MLQLENISKSFNDQKILNNINLNFNKNEKIMIIGPSGSGKTTLLNLIFNLTKPSMGKIKYKNKNITEIDEDLYHQKIGYVLQQFELIDNLSVKDNILLPTMINKKNINFSHVIKELNINDLINKKINELSGGQKQKIAIARAIINNPDIIIADEPTGALDSKSSEEIMNLLMNITKDKLFIMVTHNKNLAYKYGTRIISLKDGLVVSDSNKQENNNEEIYTKEKRKRINLINSFKLTINNIKTKKLRFFLTLFGATIGLLSLSLVINLSTSLNKQIDTYKNDSLKTFPIIINNEVVGSSNEYTYPKYNGLKKITIKNNEINIEKAKYINDIDKSLLVGISNKYLDNIYLLTDKLYLISQNDILTLPKSINKNDYLLANFDLLDGKLPSNKNEMVIILNGNNETSESLINNLDPNIFNTNIKLLSNEEIFVYENNEFIKNDLNHMYDKSKIKMHVVGIIRGKKDNDTYKEISGLGVSEEIVDDLLMINQNSGIINEQRKSSHDLIDKEIITNLNQTLRKYNYNTNPLEISLFPKDNNAREKIISYLNNYKDKINYIDYASLYLETTKTLINSITVILGLFSFISLIIVIVLIGILSYIAVLEKTKYIGILRILGINKRDIKRIFNNENLLIAFISIIISFIISNNVLNLIYKSLLKSSNQINYSVYFIIYLSCIYIILLSGYIPINKTISKEIVNNVN